MVEYDEDGNSDGENEEAEGEEVEDVKFEHEVAAVKIRVT